jgi:hypothetical protein
MNVRDFLYSGYELFNFAFGSDLNKEKPGNKQMKFRWNIITFNKGLFLSYIFVDECQICKIEN